MEEIKTPKRPIIYYLIIVIVSMLILNLFVMPKLMSKQFEESTYSDFLSMIERGKIKEVEIQEQQILFSDTSEPTKYYKTGLMNDPEYYKTGLMNDPELVSRLEKAGVVFTATIEEQASPWLTLLIGYVVPILIFFVVGRLLTLLIEMFVMWFFVTLLKLNSDLQVVIFTIVAQIFVIVGNYVFSKLFVFKKEK